MLVFAEAQIFMNYHETTMKSYCMITLLKYIPENALPNKEEN